MRVASLVLIVLGLSLMGIAARADAECKPVYIMGQGTKIVCTQITPSPCKVVYVMGQGQTIVCERK